MTIYLWKKKLREEGIIGLKNKSIVPINKRKSKIKEETKEYIRQYRTKYKGVSKEVKYLQLKRYCKGKGIKEISESSIGRIAGKKRKKKKKNRYRNMKIKELGEIVQIDSIHLRYGNINLYAITAIDRISRYVYAKVYKVLNSNITKDFMIEMKGKEPSSIKAIQTDNGFRK